MSNEYRDAYGTNTDSAETCRRAYEVNKTPTDYFRAYGPEQKRLEVKRAPECNYQTNRPNEVKYQLGDIKKVLEWVKSVQEKEIQYKKR